MPVPWETLPAVGARDASLVVTNLNLQRRHMDEPAGAAAAKLANLGAGRPPAFGAAEPAAELDETAEGARQESCAPPRKTGTTSCAGAAAMD